MLDELRGQISIEVILILGLILILTLSITQFVGPSLEQDQVMSAAKTGFIDASNDIAYNGTGNVIRLNNMSYSGGNIKVSVFSKKTDFATINNIKSSTKEKMLSNIVTVTGFYRSSDTIIGRYFNYTITSNNILIS